MSTNLRSQETKTDFIHVHNYSVVSSHFRHKYVTLSLASVVVGAGEAALGTAVL